MKYILVSDNMTTFMWNSAHMNATWAISGCDLKNYPDALVPGENVSSEVVQNQNG